MDAVRFLIFSYMHLHKLYNHKTQGLSAAFPYKLYIIQCDFLVMVYGIVSIKRKLFHDNPTTTVENYFVTDAVLDWVGNEGLGIIGPNSRNRIPKDIKPFYLHKEKKIATMKHANSARFFETIVAVKNDLRGFQLVHVPFQ